MPVHQRIMHHLSRQKEHAITHIGRHHKKYLFGTGVMVGMFALGSIVLIGVFLGMNMMVGRSQAIYQQKAIYRQLAVFNVIDDFIHQRVNDISAKENPGTAELDRQFPIIDAAYHSAKNLNEKYRAAQVMVKFVTEGRDIVRALGYTTPEEDRAFDAMITEFYQIR